jgi:hypothetical protein
MFGVGCRAGEIHNNTFDAVFHQGDVPVEQEADFTFAQLQLGHQLRFMDGLQLFDNFVFNNNQIIYRHVNAIPDLNCLIFIGQWQ